jgi:hypothetical protein
MSAATMNAPPAARKAHYAQARSSLRTRSTLASYARYEAEKAIWTSLHADATPGEYQAAMRAIAKACGV